MKTAQFQTKHNLAAEKSSNSSLGFWLYLMTDMILFASLFATYIILHSGTAGGVSSKEIFDLEYVLVETFILLTSSLTVGLAFLQIKLGNKQLGSNFLIITIALGLAFVGLELNEFSELIRDGNGPNNSAFLSAYFTLVGTHGLHIAIGIIWAVVLFSYIHTKGLSDNLLRKFGLFAVFWHFLDLVWIFIFTIVYLLGAIS